MLKYKIRFRKRYDIINNSIGKEYVFNRSESQYKMISGMHKPQFVVLFSVLIVEHEGLAQTVEPWEEGIGNQLKY